MGEVELGGDFAAALPELAVPWRAAATPDPAVVMLDDDVAREAGLDPDRLRGPDGARLLTGERPPPGATPVAQAYAGHQFGGYSPRLGDGRALLLGELRGADGRWRDLHLKGSGRTPFARGGDGLAALGPMLREFVFATSMHALGVPTTRALAVVATGGVVQREVPLPGAVLARTAASHLRVGTFQFARATGDVGLLDRLVRYAIARHHPTAEGAERPALALLDAVTAAQADLVARWMSVGFVHGVMNTDNMTISGETIDYGPCAFTDVLDPAAVFSSIDTEGRYAFGNQPAVATWNLARLAETLLPLIHDEETRAVEMATATLHGFAAQYATAWTAEMARKLGLPTAADIASTAGDLMVLLREGRIDHVGFFRDLGIAARGDDEPARGRFLDLAGIDAWLARWRAHAGQAGPDAETMDAANPVYLPRNHVVEEVLTAATDGDLDPVRALVDVLREPFTPRPGLERYAEPAPSSFDETFRTFCGT